MELGQCILRENTCYQRNLEVADSRYATFQSRGPLGVMIHSTGANNPSLRRYLGPDDGTIGVNQYGNHWNRPGLSVCVHAFIGKDKDGIVRAYQTLPWNFRGWHCAGDGNDTHVSMEICEDGLEDERYFTRCFALAAELTAKICKQYGLDPLSDGVVLDHTEGYRAGIASNHADVGHWLKRWGKTMDDFRHDTAQRMRMEESASPEAPEEPEMPQDPEGEVGERNEVGQKRYETLEAVPQWARDSVAPLVERGVIRGDGQGLGLSHDMIRLLVVLDRLGLAECEIEDRP